MEKLDARNIGFMLLSVCDTLIDAEEKLCMLDSHVGDGDHGITISRGFRAVKKGILEEEGGTPDRLFMIAGDALSETMGGAIGPIIGGIFCAMGETLRGRREITAEAWVAMLEAALLEAETIGGAKRGDRTLIDALSPAVEEAKKAYQGGASLVVVLEAAAAGALRGAEATKFMTAKKGRAKFLGEKSFGYQDAGATSVSLIISSMASYCSRN
jgi:dihydroxyacetone kinase phosphoprotein-dependent L subunit